MRISMWVMFACAQMFTVVDTKSSSQIWFQWTRMLKVIPICGAHCILVLWRCGCANKTHGINSRGNKLPIPQPTKAHNDRHHTALSGNARTQKETIRVLSQHYCHAMSGLCDGTAWCVRTHITIEPMTMVLAANDRGYFTRVHPHNTRTHTITGHKQRTACIIVHTTHLPFCMTSRTGGCWWQGPKCARRMWPKVNNTRSKLYGIYCTYIPTKWVKLYIENSILWYVIA